MSKDPSTAFQNLLDQLRVYALKGTHPDAFTVKRMKKEAQKIITTNIALGASAYGLIAAMEGNLEEAEKQHALAMYVSRKPEYIKYRAMSMRTLNKYTESYRLMQSIMKVMPDPVGLITAEIILAAETGHYQQIKDYYDELIRIKANVSTEILRLVYYSCLIINSKIDLDIFQFTVFLLKSLQKINHAKNSSIRVELIGEELFYWVEIVKDENTIAKMNMQLFNGLALITIYNLDHLHISFRAKQETPEMQIEDIYKVINAQ